MKIKFIALLALISIAFSSCDVTDDDQPRLKLTALAITDVEIPDPFVFGQVNEIIVRYNQPSDCHNFYAFDVRSNLNEREVIVYSEFFESEGCTPGPIPTEQVLRFRATSNGTIVFKFLTGIDNNGENEFLEIEVEVQE
ncbi:hypothetical protein SAMN05192588_2408 [Nonlabens sp. Hel1_33_55]|uniref:hypothetical protein n=1 Tax=Nonlabens sp. Hel1_33_55 TaxID=1336802 RepID=UPI000875B057|nr:hypothetical protein [Nonlabens sp. Hel1_33_55]SCY34853.1 hypothetical protein SAMN05192588_2408 [Nonlabens sp. Hel1_33_55]